MRHRTGPSNVLPLLLPWLGFVALTLSMPACETRSAHADLPGDGVALEIDATLSEAE